MKPNAVIVHRPDLMQPPARPASSPAIQAPHPHGLGDVVAIFAQPIAHLVDKTLGSKLSGCSPCAQRQAALNRLVPDIFKPFTR